MIGALDLGVTVLDTSTNYLHFRSHEVLARVAGDLLPKFHLSTKVGYFPGISGAEHSLAPERLHNSVEEAARALGREPDLVFLHNPEHSLTPGTAQSSEALAEACAALASATSRGLCAAWGIATWDPTALPPLVDASAPNPSTLMVRAGLLVGVGTLDAAEALMEAWGLGTGAMWGMSPFGGSIKAPVWARVDSRVFLRDGGGYSRAQAAFRVAYQLPSVGAVAVGTDEPAHLGELVGALAAVPDEQAVAEYRTLLRDRPSTQSA
ncbi:aldo/keto reductase [Streptomyces cellostaticus]|uniref:aldo/keto reductase n=1 Tax=Streptomyces cellostaticus TaxID=67285 RepID=UPI002025EAD9|nr:aldo/keto reductase [Streptomyces cellostaticus]